jgi:hypothetical protein
MVIIVVYKSVIKKQLFLEHKICSDFLVCVLFILSITQLTIIKLCEIDSTYFIVRNFFKLFIYSHVHTLFESFAS